MAVEAMSVEQLIESFDLLDEWDERYRYIIELGDQLDEMPAELKTEQSRVEGCVSNVWLVYEVQAGNPPRIQFIADSDSQIVRGLVAMLLMIYSGRTPQEIIDVDIDAVFDRVGLKQHLSRSRSNGLRSMVRRIRQIAVEQAAV